MKNRRGEGLPYLGAAMEGGGLEGEKQGSSLGGGRQGAAGLAAVGRGQRVWRLEARS
jgi:hypothetical protein